VLQSPDNIEECDEKGSEIKRMAFTQEDKQKLVKKLQLKKSDTGSPEVQVGIITGRLANLENHFKKHVKDHHSRRGLLKLVSQRRKLLNYLRAHHFDRYQKLITELGIRK